MPDISNFEKCLRTAEHMVYKLTYWLKTQPVSLRPVICFCFFSPVCDTNFIISKIRQYVFDAKMTCLLNERQKKIQQVFGEDN